MARQSDMKLPEALDRLGYVSGEAVAKAMAEQNGLEYVRLAEITVPPSIVELVPESVARENAILPLSEEDGGLRVVVSDPDDFETFEKLRFILNRPIEPVLAPRDSIVEAINRHYGQTVGESADSLLQEFTDTANLISRRPKIRKSAGGRQSMILRLRLSALPIFSSARRSTFVPPTSMSNPLRIASESDTGSTVCLSSETAPPKGYRVPSSRVSRFFPSSILPNGVEPKTDVSRSRWGEKELDLRVSVIPTNHGAVRS